MSDQSPDLQGFPSEAVTPPGADPTQRVFQLATGYIASAALYVAVKLRVADHLADAPRSAEDLARETGANPDALYRVLRALASLGLFEETSPGVFANNASSHTLNSGAAGSTHHMALWLADPFHFKVYAEAMHSVITAQPAATAS